MTSQQANLFGEPPQSAESSQWWTPPSLARRLVEWVPPGSRVIEPSCGSGNLIAALLERGHDPELITGVELDPLWAEHCRHRFGGRVRIVTQDFLSHYGQYDCALTNPPYEKGQHSAFLEGLLDMGVPLVVGVFPHPIEFGVDRDHLWRTKARVWRRARLPARVSYGGEHSASFETICLAVKRRDRERAEGEINYPAEEVWS